MTTMKMEVQPNAINRICHHSSLLLLTVVMGLSIPVTVGTGGRLFVSEGIVMSSEKHTPNGLRTVVVFALPAQACKEVTHEPVRRTKSLAFEHERQLDDPGPEQLPQELWQLWQEFAFGSQNWFLEHVGMQRPLPRMGLLGGQVVH